MKKFLAGLGVFVAIGLVVSFLVAHAPNELEHSGLFEAIGDIKLDDDNEIIFGADNDFNIEFRAASGKLEFVSAHPRENATADITMDSAGAVAFAGAVSFAGVTTLTESLGLYSRSEAQLKAITPVAGEVYYDNTNHMVVIATEAVAGGFSKIDDATASPTGW